MSRATTIRSVEELIADRDMLQSELVNMDRQIEILTGELENTRLCRERVWLRLSAIEAALAEENKGA
jgi:hypothetical protein